MFLPSNSRERRGATDALDNMRDYDLVPVVLDKESGGHRHAIPRTIRLELRYYQMTKGRKRLVDARLHFEDICTTQKPEHFGGSLHILDMMQERGIHPCEVDVNGNMKSQHYNLEIHYEALYWFELLNNFEFSGSVYFFFFAVMGLIACMIGVFAYGMNRLLTKLRYPPRFMGLELMKLVSVPQLKGVSLALMPYIATLMIIYTIFMDISFSGIHRNWIGRGIVLVSFQTRRPRGLGWRKV